MHPAQIDPLRPFSLSEIHAERLSAQGVSPEAVLDIQLLYRTMDKLPVKQRDALVLFEISGFSMKEIAEIQGSTEGAVKTKISRGRQKLKDMLREKGYNIARRTVAKYREQLNIPVARLRKEL